MVLVVPGGADDDELVAPPVDARPVPRNRVHLDAAPRERQYGELVVDDPAGRVAKREEGDSAHSGLGVNDELRAAEEGDCLAGVLVAHDGVPELRRAAEVQRLRHDGDGALSRRAEEIRLELDRREAGGALRKIRDAAIAAGR